MKTFEEWWRSLSNNDRVYMDFGTANLAWNDARKGMVPAPVWISVDQRLPALQEPVLVWGLASLVPMRGWLDNEGKWRRETGTDGPTRMTHWMPMPPPPAPSDPFEKWWESQPPAAPGSFQEIEGSKLIGTAWTTKNSGRAIWDAAKKAL